MKKLLFVTFLFLSLGFVFVWKTEAVFYPIAELGNCRDAQECRYYCEVPENKPACWSYGTYVLQKSVLGDQTTDSEMTRKGVTFPIAELGNCASAQACKAFCDQEQNKELCRKFAARKSLIKQQNLQEKEGILIYAKQELGCQDQNSCRAFCEQPANREKCATFAKRRGLGQGQKAEMLKERMMEERKKNATGAALRACATERECMEICKQNPAKCPGFPPRMEKPERMEKSARPSQMPWRNDVPKPSANPFELNPSSFRQ